MKNYFIASLIISSTLFGCLEENPNSEVTQVQTELEFPLREVKTLNFYVDQIKGDTVWMKTISEKASKAGVSIEEMIKIDAEYIEFQEAEIVKIENQIITDKKWLDMVKQKATEQNVTVEEMIRADAYYIYQKNNEAK